MTGKKTMRDVFIRGLTGLMREDESIFFLTADFGAPSLDALAAGFPERFINVGIAEQNLINIASGLALEGFKVFAYAIAPFITMRCYEQIRINLALLSEVRCLNVNLIGIGGGFSYAVSGPSHQAMEDITIMRALPGVDVFSPSCPEQTEVFVKYSLDVPGIKYLRLEGRPVERIYPKVSIKDIERGFMEAVPGGGACIVSTGFMTVKALEIAGELRKENIHVKVLDFIMLKNYDHDALLKCFKDVSKIIVMEEAFREKGGLDSLILHFLNAAGLSIEVYPRGLEDHYSFELGTRETLHEAYGVNKEEIKDILRGNG
jgi:transketolase